ncbi:hypothetical protein B5X24_HaOG211326 [Helicoverpa armigera]|uniref:Uncharacterized protein n=1 Tax=Helicoverpa armigera TaxID=29058 RepID=A0A2W1BEU8_HELAM|nr:hypothetical protein B5X24_HaOG211326 [Helicoverpa armigera]
MKSFALILVVAVLAQNAYSQAICRGSAPIAISSPLVTAVAQPSVAASLADTLSLLTVSSLLSETLPLNPNVVATVPVPVGPTYAYAPVSYGGCGCGCGCGYNGLGYSYIF